MRLGRTLPPAETLGGLASLLSLGYTATFAGDGLLAPSSGRGSLVRVG
ncbi:MAG TPA: hypothetical protein VGN18_11725 [Jatrophihabitans sp.]|nr:hypothetical protein [Jatrophihabitans sp.]